MLHRLPALESLPWTLIQKTDASLASRFETCQNPPRLHSWPGQATFDDEDVDDFEGDDDDLPGLRTVHFAPINLRVHETSCSDSGHPDSLRLKH